MQVLLTGATGFLGAHTVAALLDAGHQPRLLVRNPKTLTTIAALGIDPDTLDIAAGDMTDPDAVAAAAKGVDAVIHAAAVVAALNKADASATIDINVRGTRTVLDASLAAGADPVIHVSSVAAVFDPSAPIVSADLPPAVHADNPYTRSKALAESYARELQATGAPVVIAYPGGVAGPPAASARGDVAEGLATILRSGYVATSDGAIQLVDVRDVALALTAMLTPGGNSRRYTLGGNFLTLAEIAVLMRADTGRRLPLIPTPGIVLRSLGGVMDQVRRVVPFDTVFTAEAMAMLTLVRPTDDRAARTDLDVHYRPAAETVTATLTGLAESGHLKARHAGRLAPHR